MSRELWLAEYERLYDMRYSDLRAAGETAADAARRAADWAETRAYNAMREKLADQADNLRKARKERT